MTYRAEERGENTQTAVDCAKYVLCTRSSYTFDQSFFLLSKVKKTLLLCPIAMNCKCSHRFSEGKSYVDMPVCVLSGVCGGGRHHV